MKTPIKKYSSLPKSYVDLNLFVPVFLFLTLITIISSAQAFYRLPVENRSIDYLLKFCVYKLIYWWYFILLAYVIQQLSKRILLKRKTAFQWFAIHLVTLIFSFVVHESITLWMDKLILGKEIKTALIFILFDNPAVWVEIFSYTLFLLIFYLIEFRRINRENEIKCSYLEARLIKSKLQELRNKIHPKFLFNTLRTISDLVQNHRNKDANHILSVLSDFLRTTVYDTEREEITLEEELRFLNQYLEIENVRSKNSIIVNEEIDSDVYNAIVPNYILQPIVEDLIYRKGEDDDVKNNISIRIQGSNGRLIIIIKNNAVGIEEYHDEQISDRAMLNIINERLIQLYGDDQELSLHHEKEEGTEVKISFPLQVKEIESEIMYALEKSF